MFIKILYHICICYFLGLYSCILAVLNGFQPEIKPNFLSLTALGFLLLVIFYLGVFIFYLLKMELGKVTNTDPEWIRYRDLYRKHPKESIPSNMYAALEKFNA